MAPYFRYGVLTTSKVVSTNKLFEKNAADIDSSNILWNHNYSLSKCNGLSTMHDMNWSVLSVFKFSQTMASAPTVILSLTIWSVTISTGQRLVQIPFCCDGDSFLDHGSFECKKFKIADERTFLFPDQSAPLVEKPDESSKRLHFGQINFHATGEIETFNVNLSIPRETLTRKFICDFALSRLVYNFTNLNSEEEQVLLDSSTLTTHDHYCIDVVKYEDKFLTVSMVCDPCSEELPCMSSCVNADKEFIIESESWNFTRVVTVLECENPLTLSSEFFSITALGEVRVHQILLGYQQYCLQNINTVQVCKENIIFKNESMNLNEENIHGENSTSIVSMAYEEYHHNWLSIFFFSFLVFCQFFQI